MEYKDILREIKRHSWWSEEAPSVIQTIIYELTCFVSMSRMLKAPYFSVAAMITKGDYFWEETPEDERYLLYMDFFQKMKKDSKHIEGLIKLSEERKKLYYAVYDKFKKEGSGMSNGELYSCYREFLEKYRDWIEFYAAIECIDVFTSSYIENGVKKEFPAMERDELLEFIRVMIVPKELSFMEQERLDILQICIDFYDDIKKGKPGAELMKRLSSHAAKYHFVLNSFKAIKRHGAAEFMHKCAEEAKVAKEKLISERKQLEGKIPTLVKLAAEMRKKHRLSAELRLHFQICETFGLCMDKRKANMLPTNELIMEFCGEIGSRFGLSREDVSRYTIDEIKELLSSGKKPAAELKRRREECTAFVYLIDKNKREGYSEHVFKGKQAEEILGVVQPKAEGEIKGHVASAPVKSIRGRVQVIFDTSTQKFEPGSILVATMTRPDFVPIMRKAAAIITDEGGLTCHAAVISREFHVPCIIGTRIATKMLKDGDIVEMDCVTGVVRKL